MKFDITNVLTVVTADAAKVGEYGLVADNLEDLQKYVTYENLNYYGKLEKIFPDCENNRFKLESLKLPWALFYPCEIKPNEEPKEELHITGVGINDTGHIVLQVNNDGVWLTTEEFDKKYVINKVE